MPLINIKQLRIFLLVAIFLAPTLLHSQEQVVEESVDVQKPKKPHSAHKATLYSVFFPGLGQIYNKKYWKVPIVYAGFGLLIKAAAKNKKEYNLYKEAYTAKSDPENEVSPNKYYDQYSAEQLKSGRDFYRRNMEQSYIFTALWYVITIIDASVDAHLFEFKVSPDLSVKVEPFMEQYNYTEPAVTGLRLEVPFSKVFGH